MERVKIKDGTVWPNPMGNKFCDLVWRLRYAQETISETDCYHAAVIIEAYQCLMVHPAFSLKTVQSKVSGIRKEMHNKPLHPDGLRPPVCLWRAR
jgi:hypothetical protein